MALPHYKAIIKSGTSQDVMTMWLSIIKRDYLAKHYDMEEYYSLAQEFMERSQNNSNSQFTLIKEIKEWRSIVTSS